MEIQTASGAILFNRLDDWYRYEVWIEADSMETNKSKFRVHLATTEYHPPVWRSEVIGELAAKTGLKPEQIKLTVPPSEKTGNDEWVEGKTHRK